MYDATANHIDPTTNEGVGTFDINNVDQSITTEIGGLWVDTNELKQLKACPGWFITLEDEGAGEKGLSQPLIIEGQVFVTTFVPVPATTEDPNDPNSCPAPQDGYGMLYALDINSGMAVTDWNGQTAEDDQNDLNKPQRTDTLGFGIPSSPQALFRPEGVSVLYTDEGNIEVSPDKFTLPKSRIYWIEE